MDEREAHSETLPLGSRERQAGLLPAARRKALGLFVFLLSIAIVGVSQTPSGPPLRIQEVKENLYLVNGPPGSNTSNVTVCVTPEGLILVDDMFAENYREILELIREVTAQPVKFVFNTHHHVDHTSGNPSFAPGAEIIGHDNVRRNMLAADPPQPAPPSTTFTESLTVHLGGTTVQARHLGRGHTNGDAVIYFPASKVLVAGDLFNESAPFIDYASGGNSAEWVKTLEQILDTFDFDTVITGHGGVKNRQDLALHRRRFLILRARMADLISRGVTKDEMLGVIKTDDLTWRLKPSSLFVLRSLPGLYDEMKAELDG